MPNNEAFTARMQVTITGKLLITVSQWKKIYFKFVFYAQSSNLSLFLYTSQCPVCCSNNNTATKRWRYKI